MNPEFMEIVDQLAVWKFLPVGKDRGTLAIRLAEWCDQKIERARWLLTRVDDFDEYPGPKTLRAMIKDQFQPAGALAPYTSDAVHEPPQCSTCRDIGTVEIHGKHAWCSCPYAEQLRAEMSDWLDFANRHRSTPQSALRDKQRAEEVQRKLAHLEGGYGTEEKAS